jgi:hypothetical protein
MLTSAVCPFLGCLDRCRPGLLCLDLLVDELHLHRIIDGTPPHAMNTHTRVSTAEPQLLGLLLLLRRVGRYAEKGGGERVVLCAPWTPAALECLGPEIQPAASTYTRHVYIHQNSGPLSCMIAKLLRSDPSSRHACSQQEGGKGGGNNRDINRGGWMAGWELMIYQASKPVKLTPNERSPVAACAHIIGSRWVQTPRHGDPDP